MADYTRIPEKEIINLAARYSLGHVRSISPLSGGQANSSYEIAADTGDYILSVCDEKNLEQIGTLTRVLTHLEKYNFPTSRVVKTRDGRSYLSRGRTPVYLKTRISGQVVRDLTPAMTGQVGRALANLHAIQAPETVPREFPYGLGYFDEVIDSGSAHPFVGWLEQKQAVLLENIDPEMARGFIHGDMFWDNLLFSGDTLTAVIDFEEACCYYKLFDIGMGAVGCCSRDGVFDKALIRALIRGYETRCPLDHRERPQLKTFMAYAATAASFWRFRQYNIRYPSTGMGDFYLELSALADQVLAMPDREFNRLFR